VSVGRLMRQEEDQVGLWLIGACGSVGCTVALGLAALRGGIAETTGLVSMLPSFRAGRLVDPSRIVVGGHEIRPEPLPEAVRHFGRAAGLFDEPLIKSCEVELRRSQKNIREGTIYAARRSILEENGAAGIRRERCAAEAVERIRDDVIQFRKRNRLRSAVVVDVSCSEPRRGNHKANADFSALQRELSRRGSQAVLPSSIYALAAIEAGCPFINFTASTGVRLPAIRQRADALGVPYMGSDGKTGETLVKSALAPMFAARNLEVLSWFGENILGNRDGAVLRDSSVRQSKLRSKDKTLKGILGGSPVTHVGIDFVPSLHDWKVAWDFIHFRGFLGTRMSMQFTWQGCDSILAAPLVIDLARFAELEHRLGRAGPMRHLACFFKDPIDVDQYDLPTQWAMLLRHFGPASSLPASPAARTRRKERQR